MNSPESDYVIMIVSDALNRLLVAVLFDGARKSDLSSTGVGIRPGTMAGSNPNNQMSGRHPAPEEATLPAPYGAKGHHSTWLGAQFQTSDTPSEGPPEVPRSDVNAIVLRHFSDYGELQPIDRAYPQQMPSPGIAVLHPSQAVSSELVLSISRLIAPPLSVAPAMRSVHQHGSLSSQNDPGIKPSLPRRIATVALGAGLVLVLACAVFFA